MKQPALCGYAWITAGATHTHVCGELADDHTLGRHYCKHCIEWKPR